MRNKAEPRGEANDEHHNGKQFYLKNGNAHDIN